MLAASSGRAAPQTLLADVDYNFRDQNGLGWANVSGNVAVTLTFNGRDGALTIRGKRRWFNGRLTSGKSPGSSPEMIADKWKGDVNETFPLCDVARTVGAITFNLDAVHDHLTARCVPVRVPGLASATLYECTITGFEWHEIAQLPELHHAIVFEANLRTKARILNTLTGQAKRGYGERAVRESKPAPKR